MDQPSASLGRMTEAYEPELPGVLDEALFRVIGEAEVARTKRYLRPLSCLMIGVDRLVEGAAEDAASPQPELRHFVSICKSMMRESDYIGRVGNELVVMLPETRLLGALTVAERLLSSLAVSTGQGQQYHFAARTSIGVAEFDDQSWTLSHFLRAVRGAMNEARQNGRNQAVCYLDDLPLSSTATAVN